MWNRLTKIHNQTLLNNSYHVKINFDKWNGNSRKQTSLKILRADKKKGKKNERWNNICGDVGIGLHRSYEMEKWIKADQSRRCGDVGIGLHRAYERMKMLLCQWKNESKQEVWQRKGRYLCTISIYHGGNPPDPVLTCCIHVI